MNSPSKSSSAVSTASADPAPVIIDMTPRRYFDNICIESYWQAVCSTTPRLRNLDSSWACNLIAVCLERLCTYVGFRLDADKTDIVIDRIYQLYGHYHTSDLRLFYNLCCEARFGTLEAYDRENPQLIFLWLRLYDQERTPYLQTAEIYRGFREN